MDFHIDQLINNRYLLKKHLGKGGFSVVWLAEDTYTDTKVAIKIFAPDKGLDKNGLEQFKKEFRRTRGLKHPHLLVASHFDILGNGSSPFLIMPYCPNGSLSDRIHSENLLSEQEIAGLFMQVGSGLSELHKNKIIHQDIKPDNVLIDAKNRYQLTDFGISRQMRSTLQKATANQSYMTVAYSPPERYSANPTDTPASDIFSFGVMCFELCTGYVPWDGVGGMVLNSGAVVPNLPEHYPNRLNKIMKACMNKLHEKRPTASKLATMGEIYFNEGAWPELSEISKTKPTETTEEPQGKAEHKTGGRRTEKLNQIKRDPTPTVEVGAKKSQTKQNRRIKKNATSYTDTKKVWISFAAIIVGIIIIGGIFIWNSSTPFEEKMEEANTLFQKGDYNLALNAYNLALTYETDDDTYALQQIQKTKDHIYDQHIATGDANFEDNDYQEAITAYKKALEFKVGDEYAQNQIEASNQAIQKEIAKRQELEREQNYSKFRQRGDEFFIAKEYGNAITSYEKALQYKPNDSYVSGQIRTSENRLPFSYYDNFSQANKTFTDYGDNNKTWRHESGYLKGFSHKTGYSYSRFEEIDRLKNAKTFEITLRARHINGDEAKMFGLLFSGDKSDPSQRFGISGNGYYYIGTLNDNKWNGDWYESSLVRKTSSWNTISILYNGSDFIYYVNSNEVHRKSARIYGHYIGVYLDGSIDEAWFDYLQIEATYE